MGGGAGLIDTTPLALLLALLISWTPLTYAKDLSDEVVPGEFSTGQIAEVDLAPALRALGNRLYDDSVFDGDWYSPALHLGVRIDAKTGTITVSNSPKLHSGDAALTLQSIKRGYRVFPANKLVALPWFDGRHVHPDGSWFNIQAHLTPAGRLLLISRNGFFPPFHWTMERATAGQTVSASRCADSHGAFDGFWYSPELKYGLRLCGAKGFLTMPPMQPWAQRPAEPLTIAAQTGASLDGLLAQASGRAVNVHGDLTSEGHIRMTIAGQSNAAWIWIPVSGQAPPPGKTEAQLVRDRIQRHLAAMPAIPQHSYSTALLPSLAEDIAAFSVGVGAFWLQSGNPRDHYNEFYFAALDYRSMAWHSLHQAELALQGKDLPRASYYVDSADRYLKLFNLAMSGANAVELGDVNNAAVIARGIYTASKISSKFASAFVPGPWASRAVDGLFMATDFLVDSNELSLDEAGKNLMTSAVVNVALSGVKVKSFGNKTLSDVLTSQTRELIGSSKLYPTLVDIYSDPELAKQVLSFMTRSGVHLTAEAVSISAEAVLKAIAP